MKQILQDLRDGRILLQDVAAPRVRSGCLLVQTTRSLISSGTERMLVEFGRGGYLAKARQRPDQVRQVLDKVRSDGIATTIGAVRERLDQPLPMGYCNVGRVLEVGQGVEGFEVGDRVTSNGRHAEIVLVPKNLCARIPEGVSDEIAAFTVIGSIALQGIRLLDPTLGESVAVVGVGLVGLVAVQILRAHGARVIGFDFDAERVDLARFFGVEAHDLSKGGDPIALGRAFSRGEGLDGVLITASTESHEVIHQAAEMSRKRGRIVLTGVVGLNLDRADFYEKELSFQVSCSYGPGRYDPVYEEQGLDYPLPFVRWTEQRNFQAVLDLLADGRLRVDELISRRVPFDEAKRAYDMVAEKQVIGIVLEYPEPPSEPVAPERRVTHHAPRRAAGNAVCALVGAGSFAQARILPGLRKAGARLKWAASSQGVSGAIAARRHEIEASTTDLDVVFEDPEVNLVVVATRHDSHAGLVVRALEAGKSVFVEKPLCLTAEELEQVRDAYDRAASSDSPPILMVGFNRRFSPLTTALRSKLRGRAEPLAMTFTCNAGAIPPDHWVHDPNAGGGRIIGEACHFVDLVRFVAGSEIREVTAVGVDDGRSPSLWDTVHIGLRMADGSIGQVSYLANGHRRYPKETFEVFGGGRVIRLENFRRLRVYGGKGMRLRGQDKGHEAEFAALVRAVEQGEPSPIPFEEIVNTTEATFAAVRSLAESQVIRL